MLIVLRQEGKVSMKLVYLWAIGFPKSLGQFLPKLFGRLNIRKTLRNFRDNWVQDPTPYHVIASSPFLQFCGALSRFIKWAIDESQFRFCPKRHSGWFAPISVIHAIEGLTGKLHAWVIRSKQRIWIPRRIWSSRVLDIYHDRKEM